ncbi:hypothetical protein EA797_05615 [Stutzerimonas zhaodongensis]|uniref:Phage infection protein n=1 Tax=Stutzerimonas zhaodongensis TaxID=1176257 RepID=A0A3M2HWM2_9GAMM|nr:hypothetical protein [Stutzerimonas zhaodongensis]MCQ4314694.1 hypothetical protein [Stutzerimonas zhaodongensis]RMH92203.1 hypothetical protein EA797_05615 [Stutzerimonas zhaodongensis]
MQSILKITCCATLLAVVAVPAWAGSITQGAVQVAQNTGAADRGAGNGSMGIGNGVERLPERLEEDRELRDSETPKAYDESSHGDTDPDMEHRPRRTLGDRDDD